MNYIENEQSHSFLKSEMGSEAPDSSKTSGTPRKKPSAEKYQSFAEAKAFASNLNLKSRKEWRDYVKGLKPEIAAQKPEYIPAHPDGIYKTKGWLGWKNWLGTDKPEGDQH